MDCMVTSIVELTLLAIIHSIIYTQYNILYNII